GTYNPTATKQVIDAINGFFHINASPRLNDTLNFDTSSTAFTQGADIQLDDLGIWQQTLTPAQIQAIYQKGIGGAWKNTATVTIGPPTPGPTSDIITSQPKGVTINPGGSATFSVNTFNGIGTDSVVWQVSQYNNLATSTSTAYSAFTP